LSEINDMNNVKVIFCPMLLDINRAVQCLKVARLRRFVALASAASDQDDYGVLVERQ
jgi:hypothetical protein